MEVILKDKGGASDYEDEIGKAVGAGPFGGVFMVDIATIEPSVKEVTDEGGGKKPRCVTYIAEICNKYREVEQLL